MLCWFGYLGAVLDLWGLLFGCCVLVFDYVGWNLLLELPIGAFRLRLWFVFGIMFGLVASLVPCGWCAFANFGGFGFVALVVSGCLVGVVL